jgi:hypothetical protein
MGLTAALAKARRRPGGADLGQRYGTRWSRSSLLAQKWPLIRQFACAPGRIRNC